jgi:hypothetical protein
MPSPVDKYHEQVKKDNPSYSDEQAWATAWSIYCKHKNPGSPHCNRPPSEYLKGKEASDLVRDFEDALIIERVAAAAVESNSPKTMLDHILDKVRRGQQEVTIDTEGYTKEQVKRVIDAAKARKLHTSYDGRFILIRDL